MCYNIDTVKRERKRTMEIIAYALKEKNTNKIVKVGDKYDVVDALINEYNFNTVKYEIIFLV